MNSSTRAKMKRVPAMASQILSAARHYGTSPPRAFARFASLYFGARFSPNEIFLLGLLDRALTRVELNRFVSKQRMLEAQLSVNPREYFDRTEDKLCFAVHCAKHGLATPRVYATIGPTLSPSQTVEHLHGSADLVRFLQRMSISQVLLKPTHGAHGEGILRLHHRQQGIYDDTGRALSTRDIDRHLESLGYESWLLQELLLPDSMLSALSGTPHVQTIRVVTILDSSGEAQVAAAWLRLIGGGAGFDNFNFGQSGNLLAIIDIPSGRILRTLAAAEDGFGLVEVAAHPRTGRSFSSLSIPAWHEAQTLAIVAAKAFAPLVTIGWDIALTDRGPVLIEGNVTWDPLPGHPDLATIYRRLLEHRFAPGAGRHDRTQLPTR
jgi:Sugar-transfer associated ATP-grasp